MLDQRCWWISLVCHLVGRPGMMGQLRGLCLGLCASGRSPCLFDLDMDTDNHFQSYCAVMNNSEEPLQALRYVSSTTHSIAGSGEEVSQRCLVSIYPWFNLEYLDVK
ncbi:hypothetical protein B0T13DRAFT_290405 [Neurospora crassa]|nr:hypothetical protein B0T13DRAFT_290405 [Neurospora crassa]